MRDVDLHDQVWRGIDSEVEPRLPLDDTDMVAHIAAGIGLEPTATSSR
jgi:hypothetical protein